MKQNLANYCPVVLLSEALFNEFPLVRVPFDLVGFDKTGNLIPSVDFVAIDSILLRFMGLH